MMRNIKQEILGNIKFIYIGYAISILTMMPLFIVNLNKSITHMLFLLIILVILFLLLKVNKILMLR